MMSTPTLRRRRPTGPFWSVWLAITCAVIVLGSPIAVRALTTFTASPTAEMLIHDHDADPGDGTMTAPAEFAPEAAGAAPPSEPVYTSVALPTELEESFKVKKFKLDPKSGNYLSPKVSGKTPNEDLVPILINNRYAKDLRGNPVFLRKSVRDLLVAADLVMFAKNQKHIVVNYGFRSNALQAELYKKLVGKGAVAPAGSSFHETGMAVDISNWREAQGFLIDAGFVGGCYGIEEDLVHYSIGEITKASNATVFKRCTLREIPQHIVDGLKKVGRVGDLFKRQPQE